MLQVAQVEEGDLQQKQEETEQESSYGGDKSWGEIGHSQPLLTQQDVLYGPRGVPGEDSLASYQVAEQAIYNPTQPPVSRAGAEEGGGGEVGRGEVGVDADGTAHAGTAGAGGRQTQETHCQALEGEC